MIYEADVIIILKHGTNELYIDELDEDAITYTALMEKTGTRMSNKGTVIGSTIPKVPYDIRINFMPSLVALDKAKIFFKNWNNDKSKELTTFIKEKIDGVYVTEEYKQCVFRTELEKDTTGSINAPKFGFTISGTRVA